MLVVPDSPQIVDIMPTRTTSNENFVSNVNGSLVKHEDTLGVNEEIQDLIHSGETNKELSRYDQLLQQVECLKLENTTLKKELSNNSSQISKLESEALNLKEMVVMLGNSIKPPTEASEPSDPRALGFVNPPNRPTALFPPHVYSPDMYYRYPMPNHHMLDVGHTPLSPSPSSTIAVEIRRHLSNLHLQRTALLESLKREELAKDGYMRQLNDLSEQLKIMHDTDKPFSPTSEKTRLQLEAGIREIQDQMEKNLGSPEMMSHRVQEWCMQIDRIELEIKKLHNHLMLLDRPIRSPLTAGESMLHYRRIKRDSSSQTVQVNCTFDTINDDQLSNDHPVVTENRLHQSRCTQTLKTVRASLNGCLGSVASLSDHLVGAGSTDLLSVQHPVANDDTASMYSFTSSLPRQLAGNVSGSKTGEVCSLLGSHDRHDMSCTFQRLSQSEDSCIVMRQDGYVPSMLRLLHDGSILPGGATPTPEELKLRLEIRSKTSQALTNIVSSNTDGDQKRIESHVLRHLEMIRRVSEDLFEGLVEKNHSGASAESAESPARHPVVEMLKNAESLIHSLREIMELVNYKVQRLAINELGGLFCVAEILILHCSSNHDEEAQEDTGSRLRQYSGRILTNLTYADNLNKVLLMNMRGLLETVRDQLQHKSEEIQQAMASILRNLSWQADKEGRDLLRQKGVVRTLTECVICAKGEGTLKAMLSALWNLSGHCPANRVDICSVEGSLAFLVSTLTYRSPSKSAMVIESGGGILRNISSIVATNEAFRQILREHNCLQTLLQQLTSASLTIVSNACGTLWNLSARDETDQQTLRELGAVNKLQKLIHSKHTVIAQGSAAALRNLLANRGDRLNTVFQNENKGDMPTLQTRKLRQLEADIQLASKNAPEISENFSPRHHAHITTNQNSMARLSLQEPGFVQKSGITSHLSPGIHYSGSLGNLPQQTYSPSPGLPFRAWEDSGSKNMLRAPTSNSGVFQNHPLPNHLQFNNNISRATSFADQNQNPFSNSLPSSRTKSGNLYGKLPQCDFKAAKTWGHYHSVNNNSNNTELWNPNQSGNGNPEKMLSPSRMPDDLEEKLRHMNDDYGMDQDDLPVNYSLQFTDEQSQTPGIQSPRTEEIYEKSATRMPKKSSAIATKPEVPGKSMGNADSGNKALNVGSGRHKPPAKVDFSVEQRILYADEESFDAEETPTNFGAIYREEQEDPLFRDAGDENAINQDQPKEYKVEDTPACFTPRSAISDLPCEEEDDQNIHGDENAQKKNEQDYHNNVEDDKVDLQPGAMTPAFSTRGRKSGTMTPKGYQETPMMFSRCSSMCSLSSFEAPSVQSQVESEPSRFCSGVISPSELPDSPGQSMPVSRSRSYSNLNDVLKDPSYISKPLPNPQPNVSNSEHKEEKKPQILQQLSRASEHVRAGYVTSLPQNDEIKCYNSEPAMSDMTAFSGLSIGGDKVAPLGILKTSPDSSHPELEKAGNRFVTQAGYITSLPTADEIKNYGCEGTLSPMTSLSEISVLRDHNEGFVKSTSGASPLKSRTGSHKSTSRSSNIAHLASLPESSRSSGTHASTSSGSKSDHALPVTDENDHLDRIDDLGDLDDLSDSGSLGSLSDGEDLLQACIQSAIPKKSSSRSSSTKASSRGKDKSMGRKANTSKHPVKPAPKKEEPISKHSPLSPPAQVRPVRKFDIDSSLAAAENKLQGMPILQYIEKKISEAPGLSDEDKEAHQHASTSNLSKSDTLDASDMTLTSQDMTLNQSALDASDAARRSKTCRDVIKTVETLNESYSVKKQLKVFEKQRTDVTTPTTSQSPCNVASRLVPFPSMSNNVKVQAFLQSRPNTFMTEGTPVEMSCSTSLSNITIESGSDNYDFAQLQKRMVEQQREAPQDTKYCTTTQSDRPTNTTNNESEQNNTDSSQLAEVPNNPTCSSSQEILDNLNKQIESLTIQNTETYTSGTGYVTSLPHSDEIKQFKTEGSVGAYTIFSALTIDSETKIVPKGPEALPGRTNDESPPKRSPTQSRILVKTPPPILKEEKSRKSSESSLEAKEEAASASQHYGEDLINVVKDNPLNFGVEDTPFHLSGNNSSLSSIEIDSDGDGNDLLNACISSAIPSATYNMNLPPEPMHSHYNENMNHHHRPSTLQADATYQSNVIWVEMNKGIPQGQHLLNAISPLSLVSLSSPDPTSNSFSITSAGTGTQTNEDYYRLSRQPSVGDSIGSEISIGSLVLGGDAKSLVKTQNAGRPKISKGKDVERVSSDDKTPVVKGGKKIYRSPITGKPRENLRYPNKHKDNTSTGSSSARVREHPRNNRNSGRSKSPCNKCHPPHQSRQLPISSSMGKLAETSPGRSHRKTNASSTYSKQMQNACGGNPHGKPSRSRSAHAGYQSSVTQIYPPLKHVNSIMLNGVASMAARGDLVVQQLEGKTAQVVPASTIANQFQHVSRPVLIKQGTFIQDEPSQALLQSMSRKPEVPKKPVKSPPKAAKSKKQSEPQQKSKTLWKGLKKLLSPSDEAKNIVPSPTRKTPKKPQVTTRGKVVQNQSDRVMESEDSSTGFNSGTWTKSKTGSTSSSLQSKQVRRTPEKPHRTPSNAGSQSSSLSLSSSSASNGSSSSVDVYQQPSTRMNIYPTARNMSPGVHVPKSPSAKSRIIVASKSPADKTSQGWRRTGDSRIHSRKISMESSSSATSAAGNRAGARKHGSQASIATSSDKRSVSVASGQSPTARLFYEIVENPSRRNPGEGALPFPSPVRRVVQEVAPFNYRPYRIGESEEEESNHKLDLTRKQTTV
ncbi:uncharacterized protein LOC778909 isoform X1 [Ciona intestinalis]